MKLNATRRYFDTFSPESVREAVMFFSCGIVPLTHSFIWSDIVTTISYERLEQCR